MSSLSSKSASSTSLSSLSLEERSDSAMLKVDSNQSKDTKVHKQIDKSSSQKKTKIEDQMNNENLEMLQKIFEDADEDGGGGLDIEEFEQAMKMAFGRSGEIDDKQLEILFMKVDTNCDGTVDWEEFCSYMLLENQQKDSMSKDLIDLPFPHPAREIPSPHHDSLAKLAYFPSISLNKRNIEECEDNSGSGRYVSCSKDGVFVFWGLDMQVQKTIHLTETFVSKLKQLWVTDVVCLPNVKKIAVSTTERDVTFYDCSANNFEKQYIVTGLEHCVLCMDYWYSSQDLNHCCLLLGDAGGSVTCITFKHAILGLFDATIGKNKNISTSAIKKIPLQELVGGLHANVDAFVFRKLHGDWVRKVEYIPSLQCFISCANTGQTSLYLGDMQSKKMQSYFKIRKGVYTFAYDKDNNVILTGGLDRFIRLWNPYVNSKATSVLKGHNSSVVHIIAHGEHIISMSKDKIIKVWSTRDHCCIQTIPRRLADIGGTHPITTVLFNKKLQCLLLGSNTIGVMEKKQRLVAEAITDEDLTSHPKPLCCALYNDLFDQVVSGCHGSVVNVWHVETGEKAIMFANAHDGDEITAMSFDPTKRRLITGSRNGSVKIWNFNNGACLRELQAISEGEVTGIVCPNRRIVTVGWKHQITVFRDVRGAEDDPPKLWNNFHKDDILGADWLKSGIIATASYDGQVTCWNLETGYNICQINVNSSNQQRIVETSPKKTSEECVLENTISKDISRHLTVDKIIFLHARETDKETATLLISVEGVIQAWNLQGGLIGQFQGVGSVGDESVLAMKCDKLNHVLFTGDSLGYLKAWDISNYCVKCADSADRSASPIEQTVSPMKTPFKKSTTQQTKRKSSGTLLENVGTPPDCLVAFRAHCQSIVSLDYIESRELIISASVDCCVRVWTINGRYLGTFGQKNLWEALGDERNLTKLRKLPKDLYRVASAQSLKILSGSGPVWKLAKNILTVFTLGRRMTKSRVDGAEMEIDDETATMSRPLVLNISLTNISGKNYKSKQRHRMAPVVKPQINQLQCVAFSVLPISEFTAVEEPKMPQVLKHAVTAKQQQKLACLSQADTFNRNRLLASKKVCASPMKNLASKILPALALRK